MEISIFLAMLLYHGTNISFEIPKIIAPNIALDFGLTDQYVFKNDLALSFLNLQEIVEL